MQVLTPAAPPAAAAKRTSVGLGRAGNLRYAWSSGLLELEKRFRLSVFGGTWLFLGPLLLMLVYWVVFDLIVDVTFTNPHTGQPVPFLPIFCVGFFLYMSFSELVSGASGWFQRRRKALQDSSVPPWAIFGTLVARSLVTLGVFQLIALAIALMYGQALPFGIPAYLLSVAVSFVLFTGVALFVAMLGAFFGDVREVIPIVLRVAFYASTISFPISTVPRALAWVPLANPLTWAVELCRAMLFWGGDVTPTFLVGFSAMIVVSWALALFFYWRLADVLAESV